jgi:hypothetical protein
MTEYTPLPWAFSPWHIEEGPSAVRAPAGHLITTTASDADAAYIVRACNAFPDLMKALTEIDTLATCTGVVDPAQHRNMLDNIYRIARDVLGRVKGAPDHG